jgi:nucleotide-binding universal stress UspA family protein
MEDDMFCPTRILVPVDFSSSAMPAVACALDMARAFGSRVHMLHVSEEPATQGWASNVPNADLDRCSEGWRQDALDQLALLSLDWSRTDGLHGRRRTTLAVRSAADAPAAILAYAREEGCDLIVMGTHQPSALAALLRGSTAERVRRHASCPVLLVPPAAAESRPRSVSLDVETHAGAAS